MDLIQFNRAIRSQRNEYNGQQGGLLQLGKQLAKLASDHQMSWIIPVQ